MPNPKMLHSLEDSRSRKKKLLRRSHHTLCTIKGKSQRLKNGFKLVEYVSYIFGGFIQEADGRLVPTNDLIEVVTKSVSFTGSGDPGIKPSLNQTKADEA